MSTNKYLLEMEDTRTCIICNVTTMLKEDIG
jgi:hypothetical protein